MDQTGLSKDDIQSLFEDLEVLNRLSEQCSASNSLRNATTPHVATSDAHVRSTESGGGMATRARLSTKTVDRRHHTNIVSSSNQLSIQTTVTNEQSDGRIQAIALVASPVGSVDRRSHNRQSITNAVNRRQASRNER